MFTKLTIYQTAVRIIIQLLIYLFPLVGISQVTCPVSAPISSDPGGVTVGAFGFESCGSQDPQIIEQIVWSWVVPKNFGLGGTLAFTLNVNGTPPPVNSLSLYVNGTKLSDIAFSGNRFTFTIPASNSSSVTFSIRQQQDTYCCASGATSCSSNGLLQAPEYSITDIHFQPSVVGNITMVDSGVSLDAYGFENCGSQDPQIIERNIWSRTYPIKPNTSATFAFDLNMGSVAPPVNSLFLYYNNSRVAISFSSGRPTFTIPASNNSSITLIIRQQQDTYCCASGATSCSSNGLLQAPEFSITNITFTTVAPNTSLPQPSVLDQGVCRAGNTATFTVNNPIQGVDYYWYSDQTTPDILHVGNSYSLIVNNSQDIYVQAVPNQIYACPSPRKRVSVTVYNTNATFSINQGFSGSSPYLQGYQIRFTALTGYDSYRWQWGDGSAEDLFTTAAGYEATHSFAKAGTYNVTLTVSKQYSPGLVCEDTRTLTGIQIIAPLCEAQALNGGSFQQNLRSGAFSYVQNANSCIPAVSFDCLSTGVNIPHVVAAMATSFSDKLVLSPATTSVDNPYLSGQWQTSAQAGYSFRTSLALDPINYSAGTFSLRAFDWENSLQARPTSWLTAAVTERTSANGEVLQERDPLGVASSAKFGYGKTTLSGSAQALPYLQAHNAEYRSVLFESFENQYAVGGVLQGEDGFELRSGEVQLSSAQAHTGKSSGLLTSARQLTLQPIPLTSSLNATGLTVKAWVRVDDYVPAQFTASVELLRGTATSGYTFSVLNIIRTGEWMLLEFAVPMNTSGADLGEELTPRISFSQTGGSAVWIDDIRVQPRDAQMTAYVYDPVTLRLLASFDDQHFALRYQYNDEGKLIRKQVETERGLKTLQETHYHTPTTDQVND